MRRLPVVFLVILLTLISFLPASAKAEDRSKTVPLIRISPDRLSYPPLDFQVPRAERFLMKNGMVVYFFQDREVPVVNVQAFLKAGSLQDPDGKEGLAELTATVMRTGGIRSLSGRGVDERLDFLAAEAGLAAGPQTITATFSVLKKDLEEGLAIFSGILRYPVFEEEKLHLAKELKKEDLRRIADDPQRLAFREFNRFFYRNSPWGRLSSLASIDAVRRQDLVRWHQRFFSPRNLWIAVSGDVTRKEAEAALERHFGTWPAAEPAGTSTPPPSPQRRGIRFIPKEISQSIVIVGHPAPPKSAPDYYAFEVLDFLLGSGGFFSRIFQEVRTDRGLAYSTGSFYRDRRDHGLFGAYAFTGAKSTLPVLTLLEQILAESEKRGFTEKDLQLAKDSLLNSFLFSFQSPEQIVKSRLSVEFNGLPADFLETYRERIRRVTLDDLQVAANRWLDAGRASILVLGNPGDFGGSLESFGSVTKAP
ncbi:MAG: insulinase family protein [Syntrophaceae bacterium]|nr:insulinase family protein [Syntrophaceae bacterium]